jgi:hypothetical protein
VTPSAHVDAKTNVWPRTKSAMGTSVSSGAGRMCACGCSKIARKYLRERGGGFRKMMNGGGMRQGEQKVDKKRVGDVQVITEHSRAENARAEEVTAPIGVAPEKAGDRFVAVFFFVRRRSVS